MFGETNKQNRLSDYSLHLDTDFSYINLLDIDPRYAKRSHLKVQSKIRRSTKSKEKCNSKKSKEPQGKSRSYSRKKSKTCERSPEKNRKNAKKLGEIIALKPKKAERTTNPKMSQAKLKSTKSLKTIIFKKPRCKSVSKNQNIGQKKSKAKLEASKKAQRTYNTQNQKPKVTKRLKKTKSETALDFLTVSQISKKPILGTMQSKVVHEYFGMQDKLSSIIQKDGKNKSNVLKLSKCKTHSSSVSVKKEAKFKSSRHKK